MSDCLQTFSSFLQSRGVLSWQGQLLGLFKRLVEWVRGKKFNQTSLGKKKSIGKVGEVLRTRRGTKTGKAISTG